MPLAIYRLILSIIHRLTPVILPLSLAVTAYQGAQVLYAYERLGTLALTLAAWVGAASSLRKFTESTKDSKRRGGGTSWLLLFVILSALSLALLWAFRSRSTELMLTLLLIALGAHALSGSEKLKSMSAVLISLEGALISLIAWWALGATLDWQHGVLALVAAMLLGGPDHLLQMKAKRVRLIASSLPAVIIGIFALLGALDPVYLIVYGALPFCGKVIETRDSIDAEGDWLDYRALSVLTVVLCVLAKSLTL